MVNSAAICMYMHRVNSAAICMYMHRVNTAATICMYRHGTYPGLPRGECPTHSLLTTHAHYIRKEFVGAR